MYTCDVPCWERFETTIRSRRSYADPFSDVGLEAIFVRPDQTIVKCRGFYDGAGVWRVRFMPDVPGEWGYRATFTDGSAGMDGCFDCVDSDLPGLVGVHEPNPVWFGFRGGKHLLVRSFHVGDRFFASNWDPDRRNAFLDWFQGQGYNMLSVASHLGRRDRPGRGGEWDVPRLWPLDPREWRRLEAMLDELSRRRILVYPFAGFFGQESHFPTDHDQQYLYIRYAVARLAPYWNLLFSVAGPEPVVKPGEFYNVMSAADINRLGAYVRAEDPYGHLLSVHNAPDGSDPFSGEPWLSYSTIQGYKHNDLGAVYRGFCSLHAAGKPVYAQEVFWPGNYLNEPCTAEELRAKAITLIMAGAAINYADMAGNSSSGFSGSLDPGDCVAPRHDIMRAVWDFFEKLPLGRMKPAPALCGGLPCLASEGNSYLVYLGGVPSCTIDGVPPGLTGSWIDAQIFEGRAAFVTGSGCSFHAPGKGDWLLWIGAQQVTDPNPA